jgi:hypothetical protein
MRCVIVSCHQNQSPFQTGIPKGVDTFRNDPSADAALLTGGVNGKMIDEPAAPIMPAKRHAHELISLFRNTTEARVPGKVMDQIFSRIALPNFDAFNACPQMHRGIIIFNSKFSRC